MPTGRFDEYTKLEHLCSSAANYPSNGIRTRLFGHALAAYKSELETRSTDLFQAVQTYPIDYLEAFDGDDFQKWACHSASQLRQHYQINRKEPLSRFICIQAETSISPLDCSKDVFTLLLSFHHVMPRFLDLVFAFGQQAAAVSDLNCTAFHHENFLEAEDTSYSIPRLGRSGRQLQNCYNLWGVEKSDANGEWSFRQMAVYHSFDVESCRSLWINIKANDLMLERITDMATTSGRRNYNTSSSPSSRFAATLVTHMLFFEWCTEGWRSFISSLEKAAHEILMKVENAPIQDVEKQLSLDYEAIMPTSPTTPTQRRPTFPQAGMQSRTSSGFRAPPVRKAFSGSTTLPVIQSQASATSTGHPTVPAPQREVVPVSSKNFTVLEEFSVKSLQRLGGIGSKLQKASLMMQLDAQVLDSVVTHYDALLRDERLSDGLRNGCCSEVSLFREEAASCIRRLGMEQSRIAALEGILRDGRNLLNTILQYKNTEINKIFTVNAQETSSRVEEMTAEMHQSALRMESLTRITGRIAEKTERETSSMHIITLVTLVFLPGTFVATLFGSGLYQWDQNNPEMEFPLWKQKYFNLFAKICFPLMFFVIVVWYCVYWWSKRKENKKGGGDEENLLLGGEKDAATDGHDDSGDN